MRTLHPLDEYWSTLSYLCIGIGRGAFKVFFRCVLQVEGIGIRHYVTTFLFAIDAMVEIIFHIPQKVLQ